MMRAACALMAVFSIAAHAAAVAVNDDRGRRIALDAPAQRIVTLAPALTELVYAAGAGDRLIAVARFSDYPPTATALQQIGDASRIDIERVLTLKPDLIVGWKSGNQAADIERLERLGFTAYVAEPDTLAAIPQTLRALGALAGTSATAQRAARDFEQSIAALRARYGARPTVPVFYEIWHAPLMTVNGRHIISDVIRLCGGRNVFDGAPTLVPVVSLESVLAAQPDAIVGGGSATMTAEDLAAEWRNEMPALAALPTIYVNPDLIQRQTPRILDGARAICERLENVRETADERR
ncbi:MAG TPA: cobalamin-binding protein [Burkholderiales bacterium]|nr:cobalamin-binding protein [Burkholderiales bacterium]